MALALSWHRSRTLRRWHRPRTLRQTHLGPSSDDGTLAVFGRVDPTRGPAPVEDAFIFRLPDELLVTILEWAALGSLPAWRRACASELPFEHDTLTAMAVVSWRFRCMTLPLLYRTLRCRKTSRALPPDRTATLLHRMLETHPSLRRCCRILSVTIDDLHAAGGPEDFRVLEDLAWWLTQTRCLSVHGGFERHTAYTWKFVRDAVSQWRALEHLSLSRQCWGLYLDPILEHLDAPSLKTLDLHGISAAKYGYALLHPKVSERTQPSLMGCLQSPDRNAARLQSPPCVSPTTRSVLKARLSFCCGPKHSSGLILEATTTIPTLRTYLSSIRCYYHTRPPCGLFALATWPLPAGALCSMRRTSRT